MIIYLLLFGTVLSAPVDESQDVIYQGETVSYDGVRFKDALPASYIFPDFEYIYIEHSNLAEILERDMVNYLNLTKLMRDGVTTKGLTFNIYDDNMRQAAISLYRMLQTAQGNSYQRILDWAENHLNKGIVEYALHLTDATLRLKSDRALYPPFIENPNFFINGETIVKAMTYKLSNGHKDRSEAEINQIFRSQNTVIINSNYSNWNLMNNDKPGLDYFREDIGLNSYYYGIHLMHPFWMSDEELEILNPKHVEDYYFKHQQLLARYNLEKLSSVDFNPSNGKTYNPYLIHKNGLPFPTRSYIPGGWNEFRARLTSIDIGIRECISRGIIIMPNSTTITLTDENYVYLLTKIIRANLDNAKIGKILRSIFGYGNNEYKSDHENIYHPAPSVLHYPQTSLRDPIYWHLIEHTMKYYAEYQRTLDLMDLSIFEDKSFDILEAKFNTISTYFDLYQFNINNAFNTDDPNSIEPKLTINTRQKRLKHKPFAFNFTVNATDVKVGVVRLFLGPECYGNDCFKHSSSFFELDKYIHRFSRGMNTLSWSPYISTRYSFDEEHNLELKSGIKRNKYNMYKFPDNLLLPKGLSEGLNLTLFIIINSITRADVDNLFYPDIDSRPVGFPFHRPSFVSHPTLSNLKFYHITIFHKAKFVKNPGYFSPHLN